MHFALWLNPKKEDYKYYSKLIHKYSSAFGAPEFAPHVTLFTGYGELSEALKFSESLARNNTVERLNIKEVKTGKDYFKSLYLELEANDALQNEFQRSQKLLGNSEYNFEPHLSLAYGYSEKIINMPLAGDKLLVDSISVVAIAGIDDVSSWRRVGTYFFGEDSKVSTAIFGAGCFWGVQHEFDKIDGVVATFVGYGDGKLKYPSYEQVCTGATGHAEVVCIYFDNQKTSFCELLKKFWSIHDPTTLNRQGADIGNQYRSLIVCSDDEQYNQAQISKAEYAKSLSQPVVTEIKLLDSYYDAEAYHQHYLYKREQESCMLDRRIKG